MSPRPIRFLHAGRIVEAGGVAPTRTVLAWLRETARCTGTKEGCNEGDCGACTVIVAELAEPGSPAIGAAGAGSAQVGPLRLRTVNACIQWLPMLDGKALLTVEDLAGADGSPHPVQRALVEQHASQCGFCTPGFAMSLALAYEHHQAAGTRPTRAALADTLAGNLCRCTGYRPILDAGERMFDAPVRRLDVEAIAAALRTLAADPPLDLHVTDPAGGATLRYRAPRSLDALAAMRLASPQARLVAGATDLALTVNKQLRTLPDLIQLGEVAELRRIAVDRGRIVIGAAAALEDAWAVLAAHWPQLRTMGQRFASPPVRHAGTLGGNVANGSPIGDGAPVLMALGATLALRRGAQTRRVALDTFYTGYQRNLLEPGEFIEAIEVPVPAANVSLGAYKLAKRFDSDISAVCAAFAITRQDDAVQEARLAFGGMAATVRRAAQAEAALCGRPWDEAAVEAAVLALGADFKPLTDHRGSADYRLRSAAALLRRFWLHTRAADPLPAERLDVRLAAASPS